MFNFDEIVGLEWDVGNLTKNWDKHVVDYTECEQLFFNKPLVVAEDTNHSEKEQRYYALGKTNSGRCLFVAFTVRRSVFLRVISERDQHKKERLIYEQA